MIVKLFIFIASIYLIVLVVQSLSHVVLFATLWTAARQASLSFTISWSLLKLMSIELVMPFNLLKLICIELMMPYNHLVRPLPLLLPPIFPSLLQWISCLRQMAKVLELQLQHQSFQLYLGLIPFRIDWFDLLAVQGTLKSLLQHHSSKTSIFRCSAFFIFQLSHLYMTTGKTIGLTQWTFIGKVMSLHLNMLSRFVIVFLLRSKCLLISWMQSPSIWFWSPRK